MTNTSYADAVRSRGDGRQSLPIHDADAHLQSAPTGAPSPSANNHTPDADVAMEIATTAPDLTAQRQLPNPSINLTKPEEGESLLPGYARNYAGFLIKTNKTRVHVSEELVATEVRFLQDHLLIASFIGGQPSSYTSKKRIP